MAATKKPKLEDIPEYVPELAEDDEKAERGIPRRMQIIKQMLVSGHGRHEINRELLRVDPTWKTLDSNLFYYHRTRPDVVAAVAKANQNALRYGIANKVRRIAGYDRRRNQILDMLDALSEDMADVPGGETGLLTRDTKVVGKGEYAREIEVYKFNKAAMDALLELEKQAAIELGQWSETRKVEVTDDSFTPEQRAAIMAKIKAAEGAED